MNSIVKAKSKPGIFLCFLPLFRAALAAVQLSCPAIGSWHFIPPSSFSIRPRLVSASSREHDIRNAGAAYGKIKRENPMPMDTATAVRFTGATDSKGFLPLEAWAVAPTLRFDVDWQGKNPDALRETEVRLRWSPETLFLRFQARYREITVFSDAEPNGRRDQLWDRDVAEVFLQPESSEPRSYKEFEISPNGLWIDLDIAPGEKHDLHSGLKRRVQINRKKKLWVAELSIPMKSLVARFDPAAIWKVNFYRVEGHAEPRFYSAWRPTGTPQPNFHVPEAFGKLIFTESAPSRFPKE